MKTFINLPVKDLAKSTKFFEGIGFSFDQEFTDQNATRMVVSEEVSVMLSVEPFFKQFIAPQEIADTSRNREVLVGFAVESRERVDDLFEKAVAAGARPLGDTDQGYMYMRGFRDLDGHQWSFMFMDLAAIPRG